MNRFTEKLLISLYALGMGAVLVTTLIVMLPFLLIEVVSLVFNKLNKRG